MRIKKGQVVTDGLSLGDGLPLAGGFEAEPNDSSATATVLAAGETLNGSLASPSDLDYYAFTVGAPGVMRVGFDRPDQWWGTPLGTFAVSVESQGGALMGSYVDYFMTSKNTFNFGIETPGTYYVVVRNEPAFGFVDGQYSVAATLDAGPPWAYETEPNDSRDQADVATPGVAVTLQLASDWDVDHLAFTLDAAGMVEVVFDRVDGSPAGYYTVNLLDATGAVLDTWIDQADPSRFTTDVLDPGTYYVATKQTGVDHFVEPYQVTVNPLGPSLAIEAVDASRAEGDSGVTEFAFTVLRSGYLGAVASVDWEVFAGAAGVDDFVGAVLPAGTVDFAAGESSRQLVVSVAADTEVEPDESFVVRLSGASGATVTVAAAVAVIVNDDPISGAGGDERMDGGRFDDLILGHAGADTLFGAGGDDTLDGGTGADVMRGWTGSDVYFVDDPLDEVSEGAPDGLTLVSHNPFGFWENSGGWDASVAADGRYVAFASDATWLANNSNDLNGHVDVFVRDLVTNLIMLVSVDAAGTQANADSGSPSLSADGRFVAFVSSATNLVAGDVGTATNVYVKDLATGEVLLASASAAGEAGQSYSTAPTISADGRFVAFESAATNLIPGDTNNSVDVFVKDLSTGEIVCLTSTQGGAQGGGYDPSLSANGRYAAFVSWAPDLVPGQSNNGHNVFVKDLWTSTVALASAGVDGTQGNSISMEPRLSAEGRYVAFSSLASDLVPGDTNGTWDVFVKDMWTGSIQRAFDGAHPNNSAAVSADGRYVTFASGAGSLVKGNDTIDVHVKDLVTGSGAVVSVGVPFQWADAMSSGASISADGRYVVFQSDASNLVAGDTNQSPDVFLAPNRLAAGADIDTVRSTIDYVLPAGVENLELLGDAALNGTGNALANALTGNAAANQLAGVDGNDTITGGAGNDTIDGGAGLDESWYAGPRADYVATRQPNDDVTITGPQGTDSLHDVERAVFSDLALGFDIEGTGGKAYRLYKAAFDREPDHGGLGFWMFFLDHGFDFVMAADNFLNSDEFRAMYGPNPTNEHFVRLLYLHVLHREPEGEGYQFWLDAMANKDGAFGHAWTRGEVLVQFSESQENQDNVIGLIGNGFEYLPWQP